MYLKDASGRYVLMNPAAARLFGRTAREVVGLTDADLFGAEAAADIVAHDGRVKQTRAALTYETTRTLSGEDHVFYTTKFPVLSAAGEVVGIAGITRDVTAQRQRIEAQLLTADRMAAVGRLAASVGHEVNNPLTYVLANVELIERELASLASRADAGDAPAVDRASIARIQARIHEVRDGSSRVRDIVRDLKSFSRGEDDVRSPIDVHGVLDRCVAMAAHEIRHRARVVKRYGAVRPVRANEARLGQVFLNLLVNAAQAIPEEIRGAEHGEHEVSVTTALDARGRVVVEVRDTGEGISPAVMERIFEPFFTTKAPGAGTGLGLSISSEIVRALGGTLTATAVSPRGTCFRVTLPPADAAPVEEKAGPMAPRREEMAEDAPLRRARILVVDDEPPLARILSAILSEHDVTLAFSARDAIQRVSEAPPFDVILCDLQMTDLSGIDVYEHVTATRPELASRVLFMTGGVFTRRAREFMQTTSCPCLEKPFAAATVLRMVRGVLDGVQPT
jgi:two-component system cell cycle sensor histidine kinase/response regulator CckA